MDADSSDRPEPGTAAAAVEDSAGPPTADGGRIGVLLVNLGTPDGCDRRSVRRYLREFLSDPRVVEAPRWLWYPILYGIVLTVRPGRSAAKYARIWNRETDESPLRTLTRSQAARLAARLAAQRGIDVDWAMRYGRPAIADRLGTLRERGCERILIVPLYPQYSASTTASVCDRAFEALSTMRWMPAVRVAPPYHDDPVYIDALARALARSLATLDFEPERVVASYHGLPQRQVDAGDPYESQCRTTTRLLRARLAWPEDRLVTTFQSRFGPGKWLRPATDETVKRWAGEGVRRVAVVTPGFSADCLETLEEIGIALRASFLAAGGESFARLPCLNDSEEGMGVIDAVVRRELSGWTKSK